MPFVFPVRRLLAAAALAATLTSCAEPPPPPPVAPPPIPSVSLSPRVIEQAAAYRHYVNNAAAIQPGFMDGGQVAQGVRTGAAFEPQQLLRGVIAYGAVVALQDPGFVASVRNYATDPTQRRTIAYEIMKDPAYVVGIAGSAGAAGLVIQALGDDGQRLLSQGKRVKQAAYDVQRASWSKADVAGRDARLQLAKQLSVTPVNGDVAETTRLSQAVVGAAPLGILAPQAVSPPYTPLVIRSMAVAALAALGYADDASLEQVMPILAEPNAALCLKMSKLNLYQCLAVSKPHYEDVFCLGVHALMDAGKCVLKSTGVPEPIDVATQPLALATTRAAVPVSATPAKPKTR